MIIITAIIVIMRYDLPASVILGAGLNGILSIISS